MPNKFYWMLLTTVFLVLSCDSNQIFDEYKSVPNQWNKDTLISFTVTPPDSTKFYNLFINVRNTNDYKFSNLFLIAEMNFPHGKTIKDTLEYQMAKPDGAFIGEGFTDVKENKLWYKEGVKFDEIGEYNITIQHAMRNNGEVNGVDDLKGITDVGFRIEPATN
ncbi:MAG: gliding motility lipoprotein GldH [Gelidibacter sp.]